MVTRDVQLELRPKGSGCQSDQRVQCLSRGAGKDLHSVGRHPSLPFQPMQYFHPCVQNFRGSTSVDSDPTHPWKPKAFQEMGIRVRKRTAARGEFGNQGGMHKVNMSCGQRCHRCSNLRAVKGGERRYAPNGSSEDDPSEDEEHDAGVVRPPSCRGKHLLHLKS